MMRRKGTARVAIGAAAAIAVLALSVWGFNAWRAKRAHDRLVAEVLRAVLYVETTADDGRKSFGSAFLVSGLGDALTNFHVVDGAKEIRVRTADGEVCSADLYFFDKQNDVARLKVYSGRALPFLKVRPDLPRKGERVLAVGAPRGFEQVVSEGIVSAVDEDPERGTHIQITAGIAKGSSGGPVVDMEGRVAGMSTLIFVVEGGRFNYAVASRTFAEMVPDERGLTPSQAREARERAKDPEVIAQARAMNQRTKQDFMNLASSDPERFGDFAKADFDSEAAVEETAEWLAQVHRPEPQESVPDPWPTPEEKAEADLERRSRTAAETDEELAAATDASIEWMTLRSARLAAMPEEGSRLPLPDGRGFLGVPWGSSVPDAKKILPGLTFSSAPGENPKILRYGMPRTYRPFDGDGEFGVSLVFYDNRLGRVLFVQVVRDFANDPSIEQPLVKQLASLYGASPRRPRDGRENFNLYEWERDGVRANVDAPRSDAERPGGGGIMSFYAFTVRFDNVGLTRQWEPRR